MSRPLSIEALATAYRPGLIPALALCRGEAPAEFMAAIVEGRVPAGIIEAGYDFLGSLAEYGEPVDGVRLVADMITSGMLEEENQR